ncbi:MAG: hypothetical protein H6817_01065 [Phycisphaerales bacterium]|nr:hypothetical protein [Phycisphaerales bacterium]
MHDGFVHHRRGMALRNTTRLDTLRLLRECAAGMMDWPVDGLRIWVRSGRGADFSGTCYPKEGRIYVNISPTLQFPYRMITNVAPGKSKGRTWRRPGWVLELADPYQLVVFVFLHECYHWLIHRAGRNERQKEALCDRFAARHLVDQCNCPMYDEHDAPLSREAWDVKDLDAFVARAKRFTQRCAV